MGMSVGTGLLFVTRFERKINKTRIRCQETLFIVSFAKVAVWFEDQKQVEIIPSDFMLSYLPTPPLGQDMTQGHFLSEV